MQTYLWSFARGDRLGIYDFGLFALMSFCLGVFFVVFSLPVFCFYSCFYSVVGTDPKTIAQSPHFALVCFLTLAWGLFYTKLEWRFSICCYSLSTFFSFHILFSCSHAEGYKEISLIAKTKTYALGLANMASEIL